MFNILSSIRNNLLRPSSIKSERIQTFMPSSSMCYSAIDGQPIGTCLRSVFLSRNSYPKSNPMGIYVTMTTEAGKLWESWVTDQYKQLGIYLDHSVKLFDPSSFISGEIDVLHLNPETDEEEITEVKQYNGSNYSAVTSLVGNKNIPPKPKDQNLLQVFTYLLMLRNTDNNISYINLLYIDRSCGSFNNNIQFRISLINQNGQVYPKVEYFNSEGEVDYFIDYRITEQAVLDKNEMLTNFINLDQIPPRDYQLRYSDSEIEERFFQKQISSYKYNKWKQDPSKNLIGDWACTWCAYGPNLEGFSTCYSLES